MGIVFIPALINAQIISLEEAVHQALQQNPGLQAMQQQEQVAAYQVWEAKSGHLPRISLSGSYTLSEEPNIIWSIHEVGVFPPLDDRIFESSAQMTLPIYSGGRTQASVHAAKAHHKLVGAQQQTVQTDILTGVSAIFLNAAELKDKEELIIARLDILYQRLNEMNALIKEGRISAADCALILSAIEIVRSDSINIAAKWQELGLRLAQTLGTKQSVYPDLNSINAAFFGNAEIPEIDESNLFLENSYILQAKALVEQAEAMQSISKRSFLPDLSAFAVYNYRSGGTDWDPDGEWAAGVKLSIPIFNGGKHIAGLQASKASLKSAEQGMKATVNNEQARFQIALYQWKSAQYQKERLVQAVMHKEQFVSAQKAVYKAGRIPLSELMSQETELLQLNLQEKSQIYNERRSAIEYYATAGKLTEETIYTLLGNVQ